MARESLVSIAIYRRHLNLVRYLNDAWIFTDLLRPDLEERAKKLRASKSKAKKPYKVPKKGSSAISKRRDDDIGNVFMAQHDRGIFETHIVSMVSRTEAFLQDAVSIVACAYPNKLSILADKGGIPLDLFLQSEERDDVIRRFVALRCEGLMFGKPSDYLDKTAKVLAIELDEDIIKDFIEIKASRDIVIHNSGRINTLYVDKAGDRRRGDTGDELEIDRDYFKHVLITLKRLSGSIQSKTEAVYN
jgi:hypothetical protein